VTKFTHCLKSAAHSLSQSCRAYIPSVSPPLAAMSSRVEADDIPQAKEIHNFLQARGRIDGYPLFDKVYRISWEGLPVEQLTENL